MNDNTYKFIASGCYFGLSPIAPGTFGSIPGIIIVFLIGLFNDPRLEGLVMGIIICTLYWLNFMLTEWAQDFWKEDDPKHFVIDEIAGYVIAINMAWGFGVPRNYIMYINVFLAFRIFDVVKVWPANIFDRRFPNTHHEIFMDDMISGIYAGSAVGILQMLL